MNMLVWQLLFFLLIQTVHGDVVRKESQTSDIEDIILNWDSDTVLNTETPANSLIGNLVVLTFSGQGYASLTVNSDLIGLAEQRIYLKESGERVLKDLSSILLSVDATDLNNIKFSKLIRIPVEHYKEDMVLRVSTVDNLCDQDSNRTIFTFSIDNPPDSNYSCAITKTNHENITLSIVRVDDQYEVRLPELKINQSRLFNLSQLANLVVELTCVNGTDLVSDATTRRRTVDLEICKSYPNIQGILIANATSLALKFNSPAATVIAQLVALDYPQKSPDSYIFSLDKPDNYIDITPNGSLYVKRNLDDRSLLKYVNPKIRLIVRVDDKLEPGRNITREFRLSVDLSGQTLLVPPVRYRALEQLDPVMQFAQDSAYYIKLGNFEIDQDVFPLDKFDLRVSAKNVTLDDLGNLYISEDPFNVLNSLGNNGTISLVIYDKKDNTTVYEEIFDIDVPPLNNTTTTTTTTTPFTPANPSFIECKTDSDCNNSPSGANKCIKLSDLKNLRLNTVNDLENLIRYLQFISNKDASIFLKYNQIIQALLAPNSDLVSILTQYGLSVQDLYQIGVCLCDKDSQGFKCAQTAANNRPHQCSANSTVPACNPLTSICQPSQFILRDKLVSSNNTLNEYRSYYCECTDTGIVGVNCEFSRNQCSLRRSMLYYFENSRYKRQVNELSENATLFQAARQNGGSVANPVRPYPVSTLGSTEGKCDPDQNVCYPPYTNTRSKCVKPPPDTPVLNYLVFDESSRNPFFANSTGDSYSRLNLSDASVIMGIQSFLKDEVMPRLAYNDYTKIPKGPLAFLRVSADVPDVFNLVRDNVNKVVNQSNPRADAILDQLVLNRVQQLIQDTLLNLIASNVIKLDLSVNGILKSTIDNITSRLNITNSKFSADEWNILAINSGSYQINPDDLVDPNSFINHLFALRGNSQQLTGNVSLTDVLTLSTKDAPYLDIFNFSSRPYSLLRLDILPGIYLDANGEITVRPTPGVFLEALPKDPTRPNTNRELIFLPGIFVAAASPNCSVKSVFMPGVMSLPIDNYDISSLVNDMSKYLNKFMPLQLPFSINGFLTSLSSSSTADIITNLLQPNSPSQFRSYVILTPLDFNPDATLGILTKNVKFRASLFPPGSLNQVIKNQKKLNTQELASTLLVYNPTMLATNKQNFLNSNCVISNATGAPKKFLPKGVQFYNTIKPAENVTVLPYILYEEGENCTKCNIPAAVVQNALNNYCKSYESVLTEFHARICDAQAQNNMLKDAQKNYPNICAGCSYLDYVKKYYNPSSGGGGGMSDALTKLVLSAILGLLMLLWSLAMCCLCLRCCLWPGLFRRRREKYVIKENKAKIFGDPDSVKPNNTDLIASGELVRSPADPINIKQTFEQFNTPQVIANSKSKVFDVPRIDRPEFPPSSTQDRIYAGNNASSSAMFTSSLINDPKTNIQSETNIYKYRPDVVVAQYNRDVYKNERINMDEQLKRERAMSIDGPSESIQNVTYAPKRSPSFPFVDNIPNFYQNSTVQEHLVPSTKRYFNLTTRVLESNQLFDKFKLDNPHLFTSRNSTRSLSNSAIKVNRIASSQQPVLFKLNRVDNKPVNTQSANNQTLVIDKTNNSESNLNELPLNWLLKRYETLELPDSRPITPSSARAATSFRSSDPARSDLKVIRKDVNQTCYACDRSLNNIKAYKVDIDTSKPILMCSSCYKKWYEPLSDEDDDDEIETSFNDTSDNPFESIKSRSSPNSSFNLDSDQDYIEMINPKGINWRNTSKSSNWINRI